MVGGLVSIIIPVKDRLQWFQECMQSVFDQDYDNLEIIVIDDGSAVSIEKFVLETWPKSRFDIVTHRNDQSMGPGQAREIGRLLAKGDYINYLDSDDLIHSLKIRKQVDFLQKNPEYGMCYCVSLLFSDLPIIDQNNVYRDIKLDDSKILPQLFIKRPWGTSCCLWTKESTDLIGPWSAFRAGEDQEYEFRAGILKIKAQQVPEALCYIRRSEADTQLRQQPDLCNLEDANMFLSVSKIAIEHKNTLDEKTLFLISRNLFTSAIQFFTVGDKEKAIDCSRSILWLGRDNLSFNVLINLLMILVRILPTKISRFVTFTFRYPIIKVIRINHGNP